MRLTVRTKLLSAFGMLLLLLGIMAVVSLHGMSQIDEVAEQLADDHIQSVYHAEEASSSLLDVRENTFSMILQRDKAKRDKDIADQQASSKGFDEQIAALKKIGLADDEAKIVAQIEQLRQAMKAIEPKIAAAATAGDEEGARALIPTWRDSADKADELLNTMIEGMKDDADAAGARADATYAEARMLALATAALAVVVGLGVAFFLSRAITTSVAQVA